MAKRFVVTVSGGGFLGVGAAWALQEIEQRTGRQIAEMFDLGAGTSIGSIILTLLGISRQYNAGDAAEMIKDKSREIFKGNPWGNMVKFFRNSYAYSPAPLTETLTRLLSGARLKESQMLLCLTSYNTGKRKPLVFRSWHEREGEMPAVNAVMASASAPGKFPTHVISDTDGNFMHTLDGCMMANNPVLTAYTEARRLWPDDELVVVSIGVGRRTTPIDTTRWNGMRLLKEIMTFRIDADNIYFDQQMRHLAQIDPRLTYFGFDPELKPEDGISDDTSERHLRSLEATWRQHLAERSEDLDALCRLLVESNKAIEHEQPRLAQPCSDESSNTKQPMPNNNVRRPAHCRYLLPAAVMLCASIAMGGALGRARRCPSADK